MEDFSLSRRKKQDSFFSPNPKASVCFRDLPENETPIHYQLSSLSRYGTEQICKTFEDKYSDSATHSQPRKKVTSFFSPSPKEKASVSFRDLQSNKTPTNPNRRLSRAQCEAEQMLCKAIEDKDADTVAQILITGHGDTVDVNTILPGSCMTLLHLSVGFSDNHTSIVEMLLRLGGNPNNTDIEEGLSPLHLSALYDHDKVMILLLDNGGDPEVKSKDGQTCYDIVRQNVEDECNERCFSYFFKKSVAFRKSLGGSLVSRRLTSNLNYNNVSQISEYDSAGSDGFHSCESNMTSEPNSQNEGMARKLFPKGYSDLMTEDESVQDFSSNDNDASSDEDDRKKLTTIEEESGVCSAHGNSPSPLYDYTTPSPLITPRVRGIGSITAPMFVLTDDDISASDLSCVNSTPPITPQPTVEELQKLKEQMKQLRIPITPSTYGVISKYAESESRLQTLLTPKTGVDNYSSELQAGIQNLALINEWGKHKIDYIQKATPTANTSKSFYNYLLLDPRVIKKVNFCGDHLKASIIGNTEKFAKFVESIFYIGKAHGRRPLDHLVEAKMKFVEMGKKTLKNGEKIDKILEIWRSGLGVIIVSVFHHSSEREANVNEACMIDAVGLSELSNQKKGSYFGTVAGGWSQKSKNQLGTLLLYKSFCSFVVSDGKQFYPHDFN